VVFLSYDRLFDADNAFYLGHFGRRAGIAKLKGGECLEFNPGRIDWKSPPEDKRPKSLEEEYSAREKKDVLAQKKKDSDLKTDTAKVFSLVRVPDDQLSRGRIESIRKYVCGRFSAKFVDFYLSTEFVPQAVRGFCFGEDRVAAGRDAFVVMSVDGQSALRATRVEQCETALSGPTNKR
jgi:hypothetical protein